uniref:Uncharacterized protein n=1 Tax=Panagrolaimus davidi TaxID=227884 RepID=A0A914PVY7_9BILA
MSVVSSDEEMGLPTIIKRFKIDLNIVKNDYANVPHIFKEEYSNYKNGELEMENGPPPNFQYQNYTNGIEAVNLEDVNPGEKCFVVGCLMKNGEHSTTGIEDFEGKEIQIRDTVSDEIGAVVIDFDAMLFEDIQQDEIMLKGNTDDFKG